MKKVNTITTTTAQMGMLRQRWNSKKQLNNSRLRTFKSILASTLILISISCSKDEPQISEPDPIQGNPQPDSSQVDPVTTVAGIAPENGPKETEVVISGTNFGTDAAQINVTMDGKSADISSVTDTEIKFIVPPKAFSGELTVSVRGEEFAGPNFDYEISDVRVTTFAGIGNGSRVVNGPVDMAEFGNPGGLAFDSKGNLFIADMNNHQIRKISPEGMVSTFAGSTNGYRDGQGTEAQFTHPHAIAIDANDNLFVTDNENHRIRRISPEGLVTTIAGSEKGDTDGTVEEALFSFPYGIAIDKDNNLFVADRRNDKIKKITPEGMVATLAGGSKGFRDGHGVAAQFYGVYGLAIDANDVLYTADGNEAIRKITPEGTVSTVAGGLGPGYMDGSPETALFSAPFGVAVDYLGNIYVADSDYGRIRKITTEGIVTTLAGRGDTDGYVNGLGSEAKFNEPENLLVDLELNVYVSDTQNNVIRKITQE